MDAPKKRGRKPKWSKEAVEQLAKEQSQSQAASALGVTPQMVSWLAKKYQVKFLEGRVVVNLDEHRLREMVSSGMSTTDIATALNVSFAVARRNLEALGLEPQNGRCVPDYLANQIIALAESGATQTEIAEAVGSSQNSVSAFLIRKGFRRKRAWGSLRKEVLELSSRGMSIVEIAEHIGTTKNNVYTTLRMAKKRQVQ
jgi:predicted transcriptional regulator